jgi:hypothetical protein
MIGFNGTSLWLPSIIVAHTLNSFWILIRINYDSCLTNALLICKWNFLYNFGGWNIGHHVKQLIVLVSLARESVLATCYPATTLSLLFVAPGTWLPSRYSAIDVRSRSTIPAFRRWLPSRCLAMDYFVTIIIPVSPSPYLCISKTVWLRKILYWYNACDSIYFTTYVRNVLLCEAY